MSDSIKREELIKKSVQDLQVLLLKLENWGKKK